MSLKGRLCTLLLALLALALIAPLDSVAAKARKTSKALRPEVEQFITQMVQTHGFEAEALRKLFARISTSQSVVRAVSAPSTSRPWHEFRPLFVDAGRVTGGVKFWHEHADLLARARERYGVPEAIIVSIIGVETRYGRQTGSFKVVEALATLAFDVPARAEYFRRELEQFLLLSRELGLEPASVSGSYAGAMGLPQFMPSSYRRDAVDFDGNGRIDLWNETADVIGSVANYLHQAGWQDGVPVALLAHVGAVDWKALADLGARPGFTLDQWRMRAVEALDEAAPETTAGLFVFEGIQSLEFWLGTENFYAILQYNRSRNYALSVLQLAEEIARARAASSSR